jgi:pimeloyl-ACP methyl ester carboxylesterase
VRPESLSRNLRQRPDGRWEWKHGFGRRFRELGATEHPADNLSEFLAGIEGAASSLTCPVLVLRGDASDVLSQQGAEEVAALIPRAELATVEKAGHLAAGDNPHSTTNLISDFLLRHPW